MKVSDYILTFLRDKGVKHVFHVTGGAVMHITDSFNNVDGIEPICCHNEQAASMSAEAYGRYTNNLGCCIVTSGPGASNAVTGCLSAWIDSIPVIFISGQCSTDMLIGSSGERQVGIQETDIIPMVRSITKYARQIRSADSVELILNNAYYMAKEGRPGPVWLDIPMDIQAKDIELKGYQVSSVEIKPRYNESDVEKVVELLSQCKKPIVYAGHGVRLAGALGEFNALIDKLMCPVLTTWGAADFLDYDDARYAGHPGTWGQRWANMATQRADLVLCLGTRLSYPQTGYNTQGWAKNAVKIVVDIDDKVLARCESFGCIPIQADVKEFMKALNERITYLKECHCADWIKECLDLKAKYPMVQPEYYEEKLNSYVFMEYLSEKVSSDAVITTDVGTSFCGFFPTWRVKKGQRILNSPGLSSMGHGLPSAIGGYFASGNRNLICFHGDGGLMMNLQELQTIVHHQIPIKLFIFSNDGYVTIKHTLDNRFGRRTCTDSKSGVSMPYFRRIGVGFGITSYEITDYWSMKQFVPQILFSDKPCLCVVYTGKDQPIVPKLMSKQVDGKFIPAEFDEMYPYLTEVK